MNQNLDFTGNIPVGAANCLWRYLKKIAKNSDVLLEFEIGDRHTVGNELTAWAVGANGCSFRIEIGYLIEPFVVAQRKINPHQRTFGNGSITWREARILLELVHDSDGLYRWYGVPKELTKSVRSIVPSLRPFVLTEEFVADGLRALQEQ